MILPPLYKYLDIQGARLTLKNRTFKHAKPSTFNDTEDLTIRSIFPENDETALKIIEHGFVDVLVKHLDERPTCLSPRMRAKVALLQAIFRARPEMAALIKQQKAEGRAPEVFNLEEMRDRNRNHLADINLFMQGWRVLCVSTLNNSERMWSRYAEDHSGIVLRISPNVDRDSKFQLFRPVEYHESRPSLYKSASSFQEESLFGDQETRMREAMYRIIYSKTLEWEYESEYRLAIALGFGEHDWDTLPYHPDEISELYLGMNAADDLKSEFVREAQAVNPDIKIFEMFRDAGNLLSRPR